ncbi:hypothetical protein STEG23_008737, partial [Scotinomys teguina]
MCWLSWFLDPGGWSKAAVVGLYFIFPGICTLSLMINYGSWYLFGGFFLKTERERKRRFRCKGDRNIRAMFSTLRKLFSFKKEPKTPLGFCDGRRSKPGYLSYFYRAPKDRYLQPYDPANQFHEAVCMGKIEVVRCLLEQKKFSVNDVDEMKRTPLHLACFYDHQPLVNFLLLKECDINALDNTKSTPLMKAIQSWETEIVFSLLCLGAFLNVKDCNGEAAIHHAVYVDMPDIARLLLEFGGNMEDTTK